MPHLNEGVLRRLVDEPIAASSISRDHLQTCPDCRERMQEIRANAGFAAAVLPDNDPHPDAYRALRLVHDRINSGDLRTAPRWSRFLGEQRGVGFHRKSQWFGGVGLAAALVASLVITPVGSFAQSFITIFQAKQVTTISVSQADLQSLPHLNKFGTIHLSSKLKPISLNSRQAVQARVSYQVLVPSLLPSGTPRSPSYTVVPAGAGTFTFSAAKARAAERGKNIPPMPARLDGSTLKVQRGTAVIAVYGDVASGIPALMVGEMPSPKVSSTGVSVKQIEDYVLSLPGVSPKLASSIRAIGDPSSTLPIPIPIDKTSSQSVTVQGAPGVLIGDSTGIASVVIWQKNGMIYGVGGAQTQGAILSAANSLH